MKKIVFIIIAVSLSTLLQAQSIFSKEQQEVQQTIIKFFEALSNRDSVSLKYYCTTDIALYESGSIWNIDTLINKAITANNAVDFKRTNSFDFIDTKVSGNTAWATYHLQSEMTRNGRQASVQWIETIVAVKEKKAWKIKVLHSTLIKRT